ncbi:MAG: hypothetical protein JWN75_1241 [Candidatus Saccharibacteria bacterium]|nr:hypothetical protein [Candidatus Saccharibacteria bacterium]
MEWNGQQAAALSKVSQWLKDRDQPVFRLFGYAGTGKTTLAKHLASGLNGRTIYAAYTGKAALVMQKAGCIGAQTIHSLIYTPYDPNDAQARMLALNKLIADEEDEVQADHLRQELRALEDAARTSDKPKLSFILNEESQLNQAALLVVDECSMVNEDMARDLMSFNVPILVLGDPAQLPPVKGVGFFTEATPDVMLTEIMRQARDNPIINLATQVRENGRLIPGGYGDSGVIVGGKPSIEELLAFNQVLVGKNLTRQAMNRFIRKQMKHDSPIPLEGDRLICLRNNKEEGLLNGGMWICGADAEETNGDDRMVDLWALRSDDTDAKKDYLRAFRHILIGEERRMYSWEWADGQEFDYAYAITCHKSQGSQWPSVAVFDESGVFRDNATRWLYTAITRAQESVKIYRK